MREAHGNELPDHIQARNHTIERQRASEIGVAVRIGQNQIASPTTAATNATTNGR